MWCKVRISSSNITFSVSLLRNYLARKKTGRISLKPEGTLCKQLVRPLCNTSPGYSFVLIHVSGATAVVGLELFGGGGDFLFGQRLHLSARTSTICLSKNRHSQNPSATQKGRSTAIQEWRKKPLPISFAKEYFCKAVCSHTGSVRWLWGRITEVSEKAISASF